MQPCFGALISPKGTTTTQMKFGALMAQYEEDNLFFLAVSYTTIAFI